MADSLGLNNLPVEIAAMIFALLDPADLISTMSSCHAVLDLYRASETKIKDNIKAEFGDNYLDLVLYEAAPIYPPMKQGAWSEFKVERGNVTYPEWMPRMCQIQRRFISICFDKDLASPILTLTQYDRPTLGALGQFSKHIQKIDRLVWEYMDWVELELPSIRDTPWKEFNVTPSAAEQVRLRRGFIRYEMMCQLTARSQWNVMLRFLDGADGESMADREWAVRRLAMSESSFLEAVPFVVVAEVTSIASFVFSRHREMLIDFFDELFDARKSITPTGEEVEEETQPEEPPGSSRHFTPDEWEKENLLYLSSAVGMGLGYLEKVQRLSHVSRRAWFRTILGHFQPAEHSYYRVLTERWDVLVRPLEELGGTFQVEELVGMPPQPRPSSHFVSGSYDAASHPGFNHIFSGRAASEYSLTNLMELGWPFWDLDRTEALDGALRLRSAYSDSVWRVLHTSAELGDPLLNCPFWLPERVWRPIIRKMLTPDFDGSDPFSITMGTPSGMEIGSGHGRRWEKDDERKLSLEERVDRAKQRLEFFRDLMSNLDRYYAIGAAGKIRGRLD